MKKLSLPDIKKIFNGLISGVISREEAEEWAILQMNSFELGELSFDPYYDEELLWSAVIYLSGSAMKIAPNEYLEDIDGIKEEFHAKWDN